MLLRISLVHQFDQQKQETESFLFIHVIASALLVQDLRCQYYRSTG